MRFFCMIDLIATFWQGFEGGSLGDTRADFAIVPLHEFKWWIYLWVLAFHTVLAVILTELMGRTYGKPWLWFIIAFCLPLVGPITILLYHLILYRSVLEARRQTFWNRMLAEGPVSLLKGLVKERARAREVVLEDYRPPAVSIRENGDDPKIELLLMQSRFGEARAHAWKMLEIARELGDSEKKAIYHEYLEIIAEQEAIHSGKDSG